MKPESVTDFGQWVSLQTTRPFEAQWQFASDCTSELTTPASAISVKAFGRPYLEIKFKEPQHVTTNSRIKIEDVAAASCKTDIFDVDGSAERLRARSVHAVIKLLVERHHWFDLYAEFSAQCQISFKEVCSDTIGQAVNQYPRHALHSKLLAELLGDDLAEFLLFVVESDLVRFRQRLHKVFEQPKPAVDLFRLMKVQERTSLLCFIDPEQIPLDYKKTLREMTGTRDILRLGHFSVSQVALFVAHSEKSGDAKAYFGLLLPSLIRARKTLLALPNLILSSVTALSRLALRLSMINGYLAQGHTHCSVRFALSMGFAHDAPLEPDPKVLRGEVKLKNLQLLLCALEYRLTRGQVATVKVLDRLTQATTEIILPWICAAGDHEISGDFGTLMHGAQKFFDFIQSQSETCEWDGLNAGGVMESPGHLGLVARELLGDTALRSAGHAFSNCLWNPQNRVHYLVACLAGVSRIFSVKSKKDAAPLAIVTIKHGPHGWVESESRGLDNKAIAFDGRTHQFIKWLLENQQAHHPAPYPSLLGTHFERMLVAREVSALIGRTDDRPTDFMVQARITFPLLDRLLFSLNPREQFSIQLNIESGSPVLSVIDAILPDDIARACHRLAGIELQQDLSQEELLKIIALTQVVGDRPLGSARWRKIVDIQRALVEFPSERIVNHWTKLIIQADFSEDPDSETELVLAQSFARFFRQFALHLQLSCVTVDGWNLSQTASHYLCNSFWTWLEQLALSLSLHQTQELVNYGASEAFLSAIVGDASWCPIGPPQFSSEQGTVVQLLSTNDFELFGGLSNSQARFAVMGDASAVYVAVTACNGETATAALHLDPAKAFGKVRQQWHLRTSDGQTPRQPSPSCLALVEAFAAQLDDNPASTQRDYQKRLSHLKKEDSIAQANRFVAAIFDWYGPTYWRQTTVTYGNIRRRFQAGEFVDAAGSGSSD